MKNDKDEGAARMSELHEKNDAQSDSINPKRFREVLGHYPTGVCVVTSMEAPENPIGMTVGTFNSVSLSPPLVGFFPDRSSTSWPRIEATGKFCVNILGADQAHICQKFASRADDKFANIEFLRSQAGLPVVAGCVAWIDCRLHTVASAGDHFIVLGEVIEMSVEKGHEPLLFSRGLFGTFS